MDDGRSTWLDCKWRTRGQRCLALRNWCVFNKQVPGLKSGQPSRKAEKNLADVNVRTQQTNASTHILSPLNVSAPSSTSSLLDLAFLFPTGALSSKYGSPWVLQPLIVALTGLLVVLWIGVLWGGRKHLRRPLLSWKGKVATA